MEAFPYLQTLIRLSLHLLVCQYIVAAFPLYTSSRWIVDENNRRVKLACANWPSHLEPMLAEGLGKLPLQTISERIGSMGFNCVRLTWATFMLTNDNLSSLTVRESFEKLELVESIGALVVNNPALVNLTVIEAFKAVVTNLGKNNIMVILDNHISKPGWCCSQTDGNGFFGDEYFNPDVWITGLTRVAAMFNGTKNVIGMSLRNELRGSKQNADDWYRYMQKGAEAVHSRNPSVLVILSGLSFDKDLSFLSNKQVELTFKRKLVFEVHWYSFTDGSAWSKENANQVCGRITSEVTRNSGFLIDNGWPLFVSEFGIDQRGGNLDDNRYFGCALAFIAGLDLDWALWTLQGSYYLRQGIYGLEEVYGALTWNWNNIRNNTVLDRIHNLQMPFQGPSVSEISPYMLIFHPLSGHCVVKVLSVLTLGPCNQRNAWQQMDQGNLNLKGTPFCLTAYGAGKPAQLAMCRLLTNWAMISDSKMHLSTNITSQLCLDFDPASKLIMTNPCKCLTGDQNCDPQSQWFKFILSTRLSES